MHSLPTDNTTQLGNSDEKNLLSRDDTLPRQVLNILRGNSSARPRTTGLKYNNEEELLSKINALEEALEIVSKALEIVSKQKVRLTNALRGGDSAMLVRERDSISIHFASCLPLFDGKDSLTFSNEEWLNFIPISYQKGYQQALKDVFSGSTEKFKFIYPVERDGNEMWIISEGKLTEDGTIIGTMKDITDHVNHLNNVQERALTDALTGILNKRGFTKKLEGIIHAERRNDSGKFSIFYIDLDGFKGINDVHGHSYGDNLLREIAQRLKGTLRDTDIVARIGGDEFGVALPGITDEMHLTGIARKVWTALYGRYEVEGGNGKKEFTFKGGSIGIASYEKGDDLDKLISKADTAMYHAKRSGKGVQHYDKELQQKTEVQKKLLDDMRLSLKNGIGPGESFYPVYQPIYGPDNTLSFEVLLRFRTPDGKVVYPDVFIPLAEKSGLISQLGKEIILAVAKQIKTWQESGRENIPNVAINVSTLQLKGEKLLDDVREILENTGVNPSSITLEITESVAITDKEHVIELLQKIKKLGIKISIDDFGSGYSSLSEFAEFSKIPIDALKIDRGFITDLLTDDKKKELYKVLFRLGEIYGVKIIIEGVENAEQLEILKEIGFEYFQGWHLGKPADASRTETLLNRKGA